jgi:hypothetical protein
MIQRHTKYSAAGGQSGGEALNRRGSMTCSAFGMTRNFPPALYQGLQAASSHICIAFDSEDSLGRHRQAVKRLGWRQRI